MALERRPVVIMSVACAVAVANIYYCQPLLSEISVSLGLPEDSACYVPTWTQVGTAAGMFAFVPLGDLLPRRTVIVALCAAAASTAAMMAAAPTLALISAAAFAIGMTTTVQHLILPFAAKLAPPERRGHVVGTILGGLLIGILLARVVSGYLGDAFGWRSVYWIAAAAMLVLTAVLRNALPDDRPDGKMRYRDLLPSLLQLAWTQPVVREAALTGECCLARSARSGLRSSFFWQLPRTTMARESPARSGWSEPPGLWPRPGQAGWPIAGDQRLL